MKKPIGFWIAGACLMFLGLQVANAQPAEPRPIVEVYGCNFNGNNDMDDLLSVTARWNAWADQRNRNSYTAFIMTPYAFSSEFEYDAIWLGAYPNGAAMAEGETIWLAEGGDIQADFDSVAACNTHQLFVALMIHEPAAPPAATGGLTAFQDCKLHDNRTVPEAMAASSQWSEYLTGMGADVFSALLVPVAGESPDADYNFKRVMGFADVAAYGNMMDVITAGGINRANELFSNLMQCDSNRIYLNNRVRQAIPPQ